MEELSLKQYQALCYLVAGYTHEEVSEKTGISTRTLTNWKTQPNFKTELKNAVSKVYDAAIAELVCGSQLAAKELKRIVSDPEVGDRVKIQAITTLLSHAGKSKEWQLQERLEHLEDKLNGTNS